MDNVLKTVAETITTTTVPALPDAPTNYKDLTLASPEVAKAVESGIRRLTEADAMGALFKVMAITHPALATPDGFHQDASS